MIGRQWADNVLAEWPSAGAAGARFRSMSTKAPISDSSIAPRAAEPHKAVPEPLQRVIDALFRFAQGRHASAQEIAELAPSIQKNSQRRSIVQSLLMPEEALLPMAEPWFWKLLSRAATEKEIGEFVGSVRSGTPFDAAISRIIGSQQYIERAARRGIGGEGDVNLLQSIHIDLMGRLAEEAKLSRAPTQIPLGGA